MKLKNILIVVSDIEKSKAFYHDLFGLQVLMDMGGNIILTEGLVLQEKTLWENFTGKSAEFGSHCAELYFEESNMDAFLGKLESGEYEVCYVNPIKLVNGQRIVQLYDPDRHVIEVREVK